MARGSQCGDLAEEKAEGLLLVQLVSGLWLEVGSCYQVVEVVGSRVNLGHSRHQEIFW